MDSGRQGKMSEKLLTVEEVSRYLSLSEEAVKELVDKGELSAYKIGGSFLRFKKDQIEFYQRKHDSAFLAEKALSRNRGVRNSFMKERTEGALWLDNRRVSRSGRVTSYTFWERLEDFLYYNDFYILSVILLILIVLAVFKF